jgi:hypothetical protein
MKSIFPEQFHRTEAEAKALWEKAIFAFDTNILVHMYRYSEPAKNKLLEAMQALKGRIWIPYWVATEFLNQRLDRISDHIKAYDDAKKTLENFQKTIKSDRHPFLSEALQAEFENIATRMIEHFIAASKDHEGRLNNDDNLIALAGLIETNVGPAYTDEQLEAIASEGQQRYEKLIPPGFKDSAKNDPSKPLGKYGDLIIWKQLIDKSKEASLPIIFICDDDKDDWILKKNGRTIGPLPALRKEFSKETGQEFHSYSAGRFVEYHNELAGRAVSEEIMSEFNKVLHETSFISTYTLENLRDNIKQVISAPSVPYISISKNKTTKHYFWHLYILGPMPWIESHQAFENIDTCRANLFYVRSIAAIPENVKILNLDPDYEVSVFDSTGNPIVDTQPVWESYDEAIEARKQLIDDFQKAQIIEWTH